MLRILIVQFKNKIKLTVQKWIKWNSKKSNTWDLSTQSTSGALTSVVIMSNIMNTILLQVCDLCLIKSRFTFLLLTRT